MDCVVDLTYRAPELVRLMTRRASGLLPAWPDDEEGPAVALVQGARLTSPRGSCGASGEEDENMARGTQKGDVYSFAIIFYEIHARHGAYDALGQSTHEVISRVVASTTPPFRSVPLGSMSQSLKMYFLVFLQVKHVFKGSLNSRKIKKLR